MSITRDLIAENNRLKVVGALFGTAFPMKMEPVVYNIATEMSDKYNGGYWEFYTLSNKGFYMAPSPEQMHHLECQNYYSGDVSSDALGIISCLYAYSQLSFGGDRFAETFAKHYYLLRDYMYDHAEVAEIAGATD